MNSDCQVTRQFEVPAEQVFEAWLDPQKIGQWMFGKVIRDEEVIHLRTTPRVGGKFSFFVRRQESDIDHVGEYLVIDRPRRLVFTWSTADSLPDTSRVIIDIVPQGSEGCQLTLTHELHPNWADYAERVKESWAKMLDALARVLS